MNEVIKNLTERRSIRRFRPEMPPKALLEQIIEAGLYAPSGAGKQSAMVIGLISGIIRTFQEISVNVITVGSKI